MTSSLASAGTKSEIGDQSQSSKTPMASRGEKIAIRLALVLAISGEFQSVRVFGDTRLANIMLVLLAAVLVVTRRRHLARNFYVITRAPVVYYVLYLGFILLSVIWSYAPFETIIHGLTLVLIFLMCLSYAGMKSDAIAIEFVRVAVFLALVSWAMVIVVPSIAVLPDIAWRINGPMSHSQRMALLMSLGLVTLLIYCLRNGDRIGMFYRWAYGGTMLVTLLATQTRAFTTFCILTLGYVIFGYVKSYWRVVILLSGVLSLYLLAANFEFILTVIGRDGANTMTLTGRTTIWENAIPMIWERPWGGYGFGSFYSDLTSGFFPSGYIAPHAHNAWINSAFETGLIGAALMTAFMVSTLVRGGLIKPDYMGAMMFLAVLSGFTGLLYGGKVTTPGTIIMFFVCQSAAMREVVTHAKATLDGRFTKPSVVTSGRQRPQFPNSRRNRPA